jgi:hypothetical protein
MTVVVSPSLGRPMRLARRMGSFLNHRRTFAVVLLAAGPALAGITVYASQSHAWTYYLGDSVVLGKSFTFRVAALTLAERASLLQGAAQGRTPRYRWTSQADGNDVGVVDMGPTQMSMETRTSPNPAGKPRTLGLVENDAGAIVMRMGNATPSDCLAFRAWTTGYTRQVARMAFVTPVDGKVPFEVVGSAAWIPLQDAETNCKALEQTPRTILVRFDH